MTLLNNLLSLLLLSTTAAVSAAPVLNTDNFLIASKYFNGFEKIKTDGRFYNGGAKPYAEGGITVTQYNGDAGNDIWVTLGNTEGARSWYPNGGDRGYTGIELTSGDDFAELSFLFLAWGGGSLQYSLLNGGVQVLAGTYITPNSELLRAGFSGGGFDQVLLRSGSEGTIGDNRVQSLQLDSIKAEATGPVAVPVPEPASLALIGLGLGALVARRKKISTAVAVIESNTPNRR